MVTGAATYESLQPRPQGSDTGEARQLHEALLADAQPAIGSLVKMGGRATEATDSIAEVELESAARSDRRTDWTVVVNLAATEGFDGVAGAPNQFRRLQQLVEQSRGSNVAIVLQTIGDRSTALPSNSPGKPEDYHPPMARYLIRDGRLTLMEAGRSAGLRQDVTDLLRFANRVAPSERLGLVMQSHGGSNGLEGDSGRTSVERFAGAVRDGLAGSGHERLDFINFDACALSTNGAVRAMSGVARHMIASSEQEFTSRTGNFDGQNLQHTMRTLLRNPQMNANQFADSMIEQARRGINDGINPVTGRMESGTRTLSHLNLDRAQDFQETMDRFRQAVALVSSNPDSAAVLRRSLASAARVPNEGFVRDGEEVSRDLRSFLLGVISGLNNGRIQDQDGVLRRSTMDALQGLQSLIPQRHLRRDYRNQGGLTIMPSEIFGRPGSVADEKG